MEKGDTDFATVIRTRIGLNAINPTLIRFYWQEMLEAVKEIHGKSRGERSHAGNVPGWTSSITDGGDEEKTNKK